MTWPFNTFAGLALSDSDESVQDEAVRTLSNWAGSWPDDAGVSEPLLDMAKNGKKLSHQILGLRGYLQYVQAHKDFTDDQRVAKVNELLPLITRAEEKRLAIAVISGAPTASALELLMAFAADPAIAEEACLPIVTIAGGKTEANKELRQKALALVVDKTSSDSTRRKAQRALRALE